MARGGCPSLPGRRRAALVALAGAAAALIAGCGGSGHHRAVAATVTPAALLSQSLGSASAIDSGHLDVALQLTLDGVRQLGGRPVALELSGPFVRSPDHRYSTDLTLTLTAGAAHVRAGLVVVGRAVYLGLGGQFYRLATRSAPTGGATGVTGPTGPTGATGMSAQSAGLWRSLGLDPRRWLGSPRIVGTATVGGVTTDHLHALVNVPRALADLSTLLARATGATGSSGATGASAPAASGLSLLASAVTSASVDLYTGVVDGIVRRAHLAVAFTVPAIAAGVVDGLTGGSLDLEVTLTDLNQPVTITPPAGAQPASRLLNGVLALESQFGSLAPFVKQLGTMLPGGATGAPFTDLLPKPATSTQH